jgi:hypothetical protein
VSDDAALAEFLTWITEDGKWSLLMGSRVTLAAWSAHRQSLPREQWSIEACDAVKDATMESVRERLLSMYQTMLEKER